MGELPATVTVDVRYERTPDGTVWTTSGLRHSFWARYLDVFDGVRVLARIADVEHATAGAERATGPGLTFIPLPDFGGMRSLATSLPAVRRIAAEAVRTHSAVFLRIPSIVALAAAGPLTAGQPYAVEVIGDAADAFAPGAHNHPLRPAIRWMFTRDQRRLCAAASGAAYVTEMALQNRYPAPLAAGFQATAHYSSIELSPEHFADPRTVVRKPLRLVTVGSLAHRFKGTDLLLEAVAHLRRRGHDLLLDVVGDGAERPALQRQAGELAIADQVTWHGALPAGDAVRAVLDESDLFVLPSRHEGLPRAMLEAMARGLPCVGTRVGGIPELLPEAALVLPDDAVALGQTLDHLLRTPELLGQLSKQCRARATDYSNEVLRARRRQFYSRVRALTEEWSQTPASRRAA